MLRTRFCPITARPIKPISQLPLSMKLLQIACPVDVSVFCSRTSISPIGFVRSGAALGSEGFRGGREAGGATGAPEPVLLPRHSHAPFAIDWGGACLVSPGCLPSFDSMTGSRIWIRSEEHTSELQSLRHLVCRLL